MRIEHILVADNSEYKLSEADVNLYESYYKFSLNTF
jgi:hypothetical protein